MNEKRTVTRNYLLISFALKSINDMTWSYSNNKRLHFKQI